jgi:hypothetical protein
MKFFLLLFCGSFLAFSQLEAALAAPLVAVETVVADASSIPLDRGALEVRLARKLKFTERIVLGIAKRKVRKQQQRAQNNGVTDGLAVTVIFATFR